MDPIWEMHFRLTRPMFNGVGRVRRNDLVATVACLQFAGPYLVSDDMKSDGLGCLWKWNSNKTMFHGVLQTPAIPWFDLRWQVVYRSVHQNLCTSLSVGFHFLLVKCVLNKVLTHSLTLLRLLWTTFYPFTLKVRFQVRLDYTIVNKEICRVS